MGGYNSKKFSSNFSNRTKMNLEYIEKIVKRDERIFNAQQSFLKEYEVAINNLENTIIEIRTDINTVSDAKKKGKDALKKNLYSIVSKLDNGRKRLALELKEIAKLENNEDNLYEVTQLLNSLMGIAVLPYEMHKEVIEHYENDGSERAIIRNNLKKSNEYIALENEVRKLYRERKWNTTYNWDLNGGGVEKNNEIAFLFLKHLRNATCHSGDNAISILPLDEGTVINEVLFYDKNKRNDKLEEFAMRLSIAELRCLIDTISSFYCNSAIDKIDKTEAIKNAELKVNELLEKRKE